MASQNSNAAIKFDPSYIKTIPGMVKAAEAAISLIGFITVQTIYKKAYLSAGGWYSFVSMTAFWVSVILLIFYLFHIVERFKGLPWNVAETSFAGIWTVCYFIAGCVAAANGRADPGWGAAAFFGFVAMAIFGYETFIKYHKWKGRDIAQGEITPTSTAESNTPTPSYPTY